MTIASKLLSFPALTAVSALEALLLSRFSSRCFAAYPRLVPVAGIFILNYAVGVLAWVYVYPTFFSPTRNLPGPRSLFSDAHKSLLVKDGPAGDVFLDVIEKYPGEDLIVLDSRARHILVTNPRLLAEVHVHQCYDFAKPDRIRTFLRHILGDGLIVVEGNQHKFLRKNTMPAFHFRHIKNLYPMMWDKALILTRTLKKEVADTATPDSKGSAVIDLAPWASKVTLDIIGVAGMGRKLNVVEKGTDPLQEIFQDLLEPSREKLLFSTLSFIFGVSFVRLFPWRMNDVFNHLTSSLSDLCRPMVQEKRQAIQNDKDNHFDILSLLIGTGNLSDEALKDQLLTFLAAGHETTASALSWACYLLAKHPEIQEQLRKEVRGNLPKNISTENQAELAGVLEQLPILNGIMHETLRLYPTVPLTLREALRDTAIGGQVIPEGATMVISIWMINRLKSIWGANAAEFVPQRWITDDGKPNQNGGAGSNYDFMTFLHGPRSCIGQGFAKAEIRCLLAAMVSSFSWDLAMDDSKVVPRGVITIKPENGMFIRLTPLEETA
ncbi:cytochrome P450 [Plectosphaerella plurivora]|uniref:Cytochrome P450 n=1 Tax=Plectosphaerella plurivora TaxID=936078 RepID=A0A9P9A8Y7_9PEZI|nr:cytochrome P450 [Plectosphaerella plurivora]